LVGFDQMGAAAPGGGEAALSSPSFFVSSGGDYFTVGFNTTVHVPSQGQARLYFAWQDLLASHTVAKK